MVYPAYVTDAPVTEVSATSNGVRVASEVSDFLRGRSERNATCLTFFYLFYRLFTAL